MSKLKYRRRCDIIYASKDYDTVTLAGGAYLIGYGEIASWGLFDLTG